MVAYAVVRNTWQLAFLLKSQINARVCHCLAAKHPGHLLTTLHKVRILESIIRLAKRLVIQANTSSKCWSNIHQRQLATGVGLVGLIQNG